MSNRPTRAGPLGGRLSWMRGFVAQLILIVLAALCYFAVRGLTRADHEAAERHADQIVSLERALALDIEGAVQSAVIGHDWLVTLANWIYIYGHWPLVAVTLIALYLRAPDRFRTLRNAMFISGGIGLLIFALYPVAPPRFGALDVVDTITERSSSYRTLQPPGLINLYAAMPSLHFGWNLLLGVVVWNTTRRRWLRAFAFVIPALMAFAVIATANHYVLDVIAGGAVALTGLVIARRLPRDVVSVRSPFRRESRGRRPTA